MITVLTGENIYALHHALKRLVDSFVSMYSDMGLERLDGEEAGFDRIRESLESLPFLATKKLVVLKNPSSNKDFIEKAADLLTDIPETTDVILIEPKLDKRLSYYKFLKKHADYQEFNEPDGSGLVSWLVSEAASQDATLKREDAHYLIERVGASQQLLANELSKLVAFDPQITRRTIDLLTDPAPQSTIFELIDATLAGKTKRALELYKEQRSQKVEPQQIIAMLAWQLHVLAIVKSAGSKDPGTIAKEARLNPFVVRKSLGITGRLSLAEIRSLIHQTLQLDIRLKSQPIDADEALQNLLLAVG